MMTMMSETPETDRKTDSTLHYRRRHHRRQKRRRRQHNKLFLCQRWLQEGAGMARRQAGATTAIGRTPMRSGCRKADRASHCRAGGHWATTTMYGCRGCDLATCPCWDAKPIADQRRGPDVKSTSAPRWQVSVLRDRDNIRRMRRCSIARSAPWDLRPACLKRKKACRAACRFVLALLVLAVVMVTAEATFMLVGLVAVADTV